MDVGRQLAHGQDLANKVSVVLGKRLSRAREQYAEALQEALEREMTPVLAGPAGIAGLAADWQAYAVDAMQRGVLFLDTLRERGNAFIERAQQGLPPVLHFDYEMVVDARTLARPVNYALVRIVPPDGVTVVPQRRPYMIIDPRAGHGPGIGGFKDDSQVGVALREGHPVYFVIFFPDPEPGQTLVDVCDAERQFVRTVRALHPDSPKPAIVGNCQGGWAAMMLAAAGPDDTGPIVITGAPMSYWGGAWTEGEGDNPMRYAGGMLGGSWLASLSADLGDGVFDGAHLVQNFETLNPANTYWDKYYHLYANVDTEPPRFLEFERWWGGFYLMNRDEIEWITRNLFVGNQLWTGGVRGPGGVAFDLRQIKAPIVLFASMGDNITPPQQAFNWVADVYASTDEIKARGQVIVGLVHQDVGHLGIFVSGRVARKEHAQIVSVLKSIEALPPGLYAMSIGERTDEAGKAQYEVRFEERRLEEVVARLNRFERADERPFEAVRAVSEFNQRAYELFLQPFVQATSNAYTAKLARQLHPLRFQRWAMSDLNPWLAWVKPVAASVREQRKRADADNRVTRLEKANSALVSASLEYYRAVRDAVTEAMFFQTYGNLFSRSLAEREASGGKRAAPVPDARELPFVADALASIGEGGYPEALARVAALLARTDEPMLLASLHLRRELMDDYADALPRLPPDQWRRIRGEQDIVVRYEPRKALETLPVLVANPAERDQLVDLARRLLEDQRLQQRKPSEVQRQTLRDIAAVLRSSTPPAAMPEMVASARRPRSARRPQRRTGA
jgi:pimeloyl-ACP methyl ester carboxylesterase